MGISKNYSNDGISESASFGDYEKRLLDLALKAENGNFDFSHLSPQDVLKEVFGHNGFKPQQLEIITRILSREGNTLGIMPTGGGKSLCFQIPALIQKNLSVVVSPLIALMKDQIDNLSKKEVHTAFFVNSSISESTKERILDLVEKKKVKLLYLAPESLKSERILELLKKIDIDLFVIDEAHCISTWGHNFRPDYLRLPEIIEELNHPQILALTATATKEVEEDIQKQLRTRCKVFKASFDRPNLYIDVIPLERNIKKELFLVDLVKKLKGSTIVFVTYRKTTEKISELLNSNGIRGVYYHAGLDREKREKIQNLFISGECKVMVATIAFGMGIDKADIRNIIHYNLPQSIENYYQEIGRAGRDGEFSNCIVLFTKSDEYKIKELISSSWPDEKKIKDIISYLKNKNTDYFFITSRKICFDCDIKEIPTNLILHRLEEFGAIKIFTNVFYQVKPLFNKTYSKIIEDNPEYKNDLEKIFSCDFFKSSRRTWLVLEELMDKTGLNYFRILEILNHLKKDECLKLSEIKCKDLIWIKDKINDFDIVPLINLFDSILNHDLSKVDLLIKSLTKQRCIRKNILEYFDEPHLKDDCEMCSYCVGHRLTEDIEPEINENYADDEEIEKLMEVEVDSAKEMPLSLLISVAQNKEIPRKDFVKILVGELHQFSSEWKFKLNCYGILDDFKNQQVVLEDILKGLINKELISEEIDGTMRITKRGLSHLNNVKEKEKARMTIEYKKEISEDEQRDQSINKDIVSKPENQEIQKQNCQKDLKLVEKEGYVYTEKKDLYDLKKQGISLVNVCINDEIIYDVPVNDLLSFTRAKITFFNRYDKKNKTNLNHKKEIVYTVQKPNSNDTCVRETKTCDICLHGRVETPESLKSEILTIGELTKYIKNLLESDRKLINVWVRGEISNLTQHASGHTYFSLKDNESQLRCVLFRRMNRNLKFNLEHGMKIIVRGNIEVYEPYGEYSIIIEEIQPDGLGALNLAFIQLKNKLEKEGLFSNEYKKPLPKFPKVIGIVTSSTGAVIQDILNIIRRRYPLVKILIAPTIVQGKEASNSIVESVKFMNELSYVDVLILGRGGGSLEDLWCFNEEVVARSIFESRIPIISAVGHETDFTIVDFVADYRAPTPSAAAEKVVPDIQELYSLVYNLHIRNMQAIRYIVELHKSNLKQIINRPIFKRPFDRIHSYYREMDHITYKLQTTLLKSTSSKRKELEIIESKIFALNPKSILKRGYGIIMKDNKIIKSFSDVKIEDNINVILHKGKLDAQVKKIQRN